MSFGYSVGDILAIGQLCWTVYRACRDGAGHYEEVIAELKSLHINLKNFAEEVENPKSLLNRRGAAMRDEFNHILGNVQQLLKDLEKMVLKYRSLATLEKRTWDRLRFGLKELNTIRQKLTYHTVQMELFLSSLTVGALGRIESLLEDFILEVRSGRRAPTILSIEQGGEEGAEGWKRLESDLSESGVAFKDIERHRDDIVEYLALLTMDSETQSHDAIVPPEFTSDGGLPGPSVNGQVPEDNWDSISERIASSNNATTQKEQSRIRKLHSVILATESVENDASSQISAAPLDSFEENEMGVRSKTEKAIPTKTVDSLKKLVEPSDNGKDTVTPVITPAQLLKDNGFDIDCSMSELPKALKWAARVGNVDVMQLLLSRKPQITSQNGYGGLMEAVVRSENDKLLGLMMDHQVDMNIVGDNGWTILFFTACLDQQKMMEMLLNPFSGVSINLQDDHGCTALHVAAEMYNDTLTKMLIQSGADVNAVDDQGESPLHKAAGMGRKANTRLLLNAGANIETTNEEGITALREAFENGHDGVVRLLLQRGASTRSAFIGPFSPRYPHTSTEGFEAARQAISWWQEENIMKSQIQMAKWKMDESRNDDKSEIPTKKRHVQDRE